MDYSSLTLREVAYYAYKKNSKVPLIREIRERFRQPVTRDYPFTAMIRQSDKTVKLGLFESKMMADGLWEFIRSKIEFEAKSGYDRYLSFGKWEEDIKIMEVQNALDGGKE